MGKSFGFSEDQVFTDGEIIDIRVRVANGEPIELEEAAYRDWVLKTSVAMAREGQALVDEILSILGSLDHGDSDKPKLDLAVERLREARFAFQAQGIHANSTHDRHDELRGTAWRPRVLISATKK